MCVCVCGGGGGVCVCGGGGGVRACVCDSQTWGRRLLLAGETEALLLTTMSSLDPPRYPTGQTHRFVLLSLVHKPSLKPHANISS